MKRVARELGENLNDDELNAMIDGFGRGKDGGISRNEFKCIVDQLKKQEQAQLEKQEQDQLEKQEQDQLAKNKQDLLKTATSK